MTTANNEWNAKNMRTLSTRVKTEVANTFIEKAQRDGFSANVLLKNFVLQYVSGNNCDDSTAIRAKIQMLSKEVERLKKDCDMYKKRAERAEDLVQYMLAMPH